MRVAVAVAMLSTACAALVVHALGCRPNDRSDVGEVLAPEPPRARPTLPAPDVAPATVDRGRIARDVAFVAKPREPGSPHHRAVRDRCLDTLRGLGFEVELHTFPTGTNVVGTLRGAEWADEHVLVGAHYDHIAGCAGANDNATGTAGVLELARVLGEVGPSAWPRTLAVACWDDEESGLRGSRAWAARARDRGTRIAIAFNFDSIGFATSEPGTQRVPTGFSLVFGDEIDRLAERGHRGDFVAVIGDAAAIPFARAFVRQAATDALPHSLLEVPSSLLALPISVDLRRSDHASFWATGVPALMLTDTAEFRTDTYHCRGRPDVTETLDLGFTTKIVRATAAAVATALLREEDVARSATNAPIE